MLKISIVIPQYNRIKLLLKSLKIIESVDYPDLEVVVSDDGSSDNTEEEITKLQKSYPHNLIYHRNQVNLGYDRNFRQCIELATGDYALVIGNDDTINGTNAIHYLNKFLLDNDQPEVGFCNFLEDRTGETNIRRANSTGIMGTGPNLALNNYSCFSFVGGLIYKKSAFNKYNTDRYDGSIYSQIYLATLMVASGQRMFSIEEPLIIKDLLLDGKFRHSYRDRIAKKWSDYKIVDGGMLSVINVLHCSFKDAEVLDNDKRIKIFRKIYTTTLPHWVLDYKSNNALPMSFGIIQGMWPFKSIWYKELKLIQQIEILLRYFVFNTVALILPSRLFEKFKTKLYNKMKAQN